MWNNHVFQALYPTLQTTTTTNFETLLGKQVFKNNYNINPFYNCVAEWRWVPGMSRGFHLWHSQPLDRVTLPWLANPRPPAMSPHAKGTRHPSHWFNSGRIQGGGGRDGGKIMIHRLNEETGRHENTVLSTWRWYKQGWPRLSQTTDRWPRSRSLLLTALNKYLFNSFKSPSSVSIPAFFCFCSVI